MYGQMTAGSWIYIGAQGIVQGTYETFVEMGRQHYGGDLAGRWILTAGLGGMGGAQPLAAAMAGASCLAVECQPSRIEMRLRTGYLDQAGQILDEALGDHRALLRRRSKPVSVGLLGNAAEVLPGTACAAACARTLLTDQTSAHDPLNGYLPQGWSAGPTGRHCAERDPKAVERAAKASMADARARHAGLPGAGRADLRLRQQHPPDGQGERRRGRLRFSRLRPGLYPPAVLPRASGRSAGRPSPAIRRTSTDRRAR